MMSPMLNSCYESAEGLPLITTGEEKDDCNIGHFIFLDLKIRINHKGKTESSQGKTQIISMKRLD